MTDEPESIWRHPEKWTPESIEKAKEALQIIIARFAKRRQKKEPPDDPTSTQDPPH